MKAICIDRYGPLDTLGLGDIDDPAADRTQVLVRVRATSVNPLDWHTASGKPYVMRLGGGLLRPKDNVLGSDVAGVVEDVGSSVTEFRPGDEVFGLARRTFAELVVVSPSQIVAKPEGVSFENAAATPVAGLTALQALRDKGKLGPDQRVLINGAAGGVGTFAVQIAKALGGSVTAVCSTRNVETVRQLGADHVVDYTTEDFADLNERFDVLVDNVGNRPLSTCQRMLTDTGTLVVVSGRNGPIFGPLARFIAAKLRFVPGQQSAEAFIAQPNGEDLLELARLLETKTVTPSIDRCYQLTEAAQAMQYSASGHARGKLVLTP